MFIIVNWVGLGYGQTNKLCPKQVTLFILKCWPLPASFLNTMTNIVKSWLKRIDFVLGIWTWDPRVEGANATELWRLPSCKLPWNLAQKVLIYNELDINHQGRSFVVQSSDSTIYQLGRLVYQLGRLVYQLGRNTN